MLPLLVLQRSRRVGKGGSWSQDLRGPLGALKCTVAEPGRSARETDVSEKSCSRTVKGDIFFGST